MKKTLSMALALIMLLSCLVPFSALANKKEDAETIKVGGTVHASISEKTDLKSDEEFYVKFVPKTTGYYEFYTKNDSKIKKDSLIMCGIIHEVKGEEELVGGMGVLSTDKDLIEYLGSNGLRCAAELTKGKTYYFSIAGMDYGSFSTDVYLKSGHKHDYKTSVMPASIYWDYGSDGCKTKDCSLCGDSITLETYYAPKKATLSCTEYTYNGKAKKPKVTVKDRKGNVISSKNYKVEYTSNKKVGTATANVVFNDKIYSGFMELNFDINPPKASIKKVTPLKKGFRVTWGKKKSQVDGYQIKYGTSSKLRNGKTITVKGAGKTSKDIKKLSAGRKYYVAIRTYKKVDGKTYYSDWSSAYPVKTNK